MEEILDRIKRPLKSQGITHKQVAERLGVSSSAVTRWLNGSRPITFQYLLPLVELAGLSMETLFVKNQIDRVILERLRYCSDEEKRIFLRFLPTDKSPKVSPDSD